MLKCKNCKYCYHHNCVNMTTAYNMANIASLKNAYECNTCREGQNGGNGLTQDESFHDSDTQKLTQDEEVYCNVTHRRKRPSLDHHESLLDLSYQSLPNIGTQNYQELEDLKMENHNIKLEIEAAHLEIENLNSENMNLNKKFIYIFIYL